MNLRQQNINVLSDAKVYLTSISTQQYNAKIELLSESTIGQHTRHFIEFYQCLLCQARHAAIDYDERNRNILIESDPLIAIDAVNEIIESLDSLEISVLTVVNSCNSTGSQIMTSIGRELLYNLEHCIHHLAIIKIGLKIVAPHIKLPEHFGYAPSTILHQKSNQTKS